jgi:hypothetical protein
MRQPTAGFFFQERAEFFGKNFLKQRIRRGKDAVLGMEILTLSRIFPPGNRKPRVKHACAVSGFFLMSGWRLVPFGRIQLADIGREIMGRLVEHILIILQGMHGTDPAPVA